MSPIETVLLFLDRINRRDVDQCGLQWRRIYADNKPVYDILLKR